MDSADQAGQELEEWLEKCIQAARGVKPPQDGPLQCEDCGAEIPLERRRAVPGCTRCVDCQDIVDRLCASGLSP